MGRAGIALNDSKQQEEHMPKSKEKFPKLIYVGKEGSGEEEFLAASESPEGMEVQNDERIVAVYKLDRIVKVKNTTIVV